MRSRVDMLRRFGVIIAGTVLLTAFAMTINNKTLLFNQTSTSEDLQPPLQNVNVDTLRQDLLNDMRSELRSDMKDRLKEIFTELSQSQIVSLKEIYQQLVASDNLVVATVNDLSKQNSELLRDIKESVAQIRTDSGENPTEIEQNRAIVTQLSSKQSQMEAELKPNDDLPAFFINPAQSRQIAVPPSPLQWANTKCTPVFFLGGGKSGSTSLWMLLLKNNARHHHTIPIIPDPEVQFAVSGKEACSAMNPSLKPDDFWTKFEGCQNEDNDAQIKFALDACPRATSEQHMKTLASRFPNAKLLMLVRDPVKRIISHVNDAQIRFGGSSKVEEAVKRIITSRGGLEWQLSQYATILTNALKYFDSDQILILKTERFKSDVQLMVDAVMDHIGGQRFATQNGNANENKKKENYKQLSEETSHWAYGILNQQIKEFTDLTGQRFPEWRE